MNELRGKIAILTGGSQGVGVYIAQALAAQGVHLALVARTASKLEEVAAQIKGVRVLCVAADLTDPNAPDHIATRVLEGLGPVDALINNAGVEEGGSFCDKSAAQLEQVMATNLRGPLLLTHRLLPQMLERRQGHIVSVASVAGKMGLPYAATYGASKAALIAWSAALRIELRGTGVSASAVTPGFISQVGMFAARKHTPPGFLGQVTPTQVADGVVRSWRHDLAELIVTARPIWPLQIMQALAPDTLVKLMDRIKLFDFLRRNFEEHA